MPKARSRAKRSNKSLPPSASRAGAGSSPRGVVPSSSPTTSARSGRRARRDPRRERNRKQLIDATLELVARDGSGGLTVTRIARAAGMDPSGFYAHFKSSKECEQAAAGEFDRFVGNLLKPYLDVRSLQSEAAVTEALERLLYAWLAEPLWSTLMLRARYEDSAFGERTRAILGEVRRDVRTLLWDLALGAGARGRHLDPISALTDLCIGHYMTLLESVVQGRVSDVKLAARTISHANVATVVAELKRIAAEKEQSGS